jgi:16S rRNA (guanine527-N7)-methyltransferase
MSADLDVGWRLSPHQRDQLDALLDQLASDELAPTSVRDRADAARLHVADSLVALGLKQLRHARRIADLGSGAGFPGLALAVALPEATVTLIESQRRKCDFLARASQAAAVENVEIVCARAEEWAQGIGTSDAVVARALAPQPVVLEYAAPLLRLRGSLVDWRGKRSPAEEVAADRAAELLGLRRTAVHQVVPFEGARDRHLHVFDKVDATPTRFPRRAGIARKRPLGA